MITVDVSAIVTCYKKEEYLQECIDSIKRNTKQAKEIIVVHDACPHPKLIEGVTNIVLPENLGVCLARDVGFRLSTGLLILFVDGDDVLSPDYIEKMVLTITDEGADITYPDVFIWAGEKSSLSIYPNRFTLKQIMENNKTLTPPVTSLMKREVYENLGGFRNLSVLEDLDFFIRALRKGYKFVKSQTLLWYRRSGDTRNSAPLVVRKRVLKDILGKK